MTLDQYIYGILYIRSLVKSFLLVLKIFWGELFLKNSGIIQEKIDLSKAYDRVNWIFLRVIMTKLGFSVSFITWVMSNITSVSFAILINGVA